MAFRFVHIADVHLDSPVARPALRDPTVAQVIGGAPRKAFMVASE
jgi:exonuclease SbcD